MKISLSILFVLGTFAGTAAAQTPAPLYETPSGVTDYLGSGSTEFSTGDMQFERPEFDGLRNRFGFSGPSRLYIPQLGSKPQLFSLGSRFGNPGLQQFGFGAGHIFGPVHATFTYHSTSDLSGPLLSSNKIFGSTLTFSGGIKLSGLYRFDKTDLLPDSRDTREWMLGASVPFGANTFMASYIRHINKTMSNADASRFSLGYDYSLSKQTHLYTSFSHLFNEGGALRLYAPSMESENLFNAGVRHQF